MARTQEFDTGKALGDARRVFWDKGFDATSITDLETATGLGRSSIYNGFGSKRGLFDAVIQDYMDTILRPRLNLLHGSSRSNDGISTYLRSLSIDLAKASEQTANRGCLLMNTAAGIAGHDEALRLLIDGYQIELRDGVAGALRAMDPAQSGLLGSCAGANRRRAGDECAAPGAAEPGRGVGDLGSRRGASPRVASGDLCGFRRPCRRAFGRSGNPCCLATRSRQTMGGVNP